MTVGEGFTKEVALIESTLGGGQGPGVVVVWKSRGPVCIELLGCVWEGFEEWQALGHAGSCVPSLGERSKEGLSEIEVWGTAGKAA